MEANQIISIVPNKSSGTAAWITYYDQLVKRYGKSNAQAAFVLTWEKRGGSNVDKNELINATGIKFDRSFMESIKGNVSNAFSFGTSFQKYAIITGAVICTVLIGGIVIRIITASAKDIGTATGTAAKAFV